MDNRRRYPRYDVAGCTDLKGTLETGGAKCRLIMLGMGGCGFYGTPMNVMLQASDQVECTFLLKPLHSEPIRVNGLLRYARAIQVGKNPEIFYGIEFAPYQEEILEPVVRHLEQLERKGIIKISA